MAVNRWLQSGNYRRSYREDQTIFATYSEQASLLVFVVLLYFVPLMPFMTRSMYRLVDLILIYGIAVIGLNIVTGFAGQISIGQAAFMGVGAYAATTITRDLALPLFGFGDTVPFLFVVLLLPVCGLVAAAVGAFVGLPSFRLKHLYLAIATLAFQVIFEWVVGHTTWLNQGGSIRVPRVDFFGDVMSGSAKIGPFYYYFALTVLILMAFAFRNLLRGKFGRALIAVRDNDRAADAMGINPGATKTMAFAVAGFYAGVAGALLAFYNGSVIVESFTLAVSIDFLAMAIVGGLGTLVGSLLGPSFLMFLDPWVEQLAGSIQTFMPSTIDVGTALRPTVFGLIVVLFLIYEPRGLANWWRLIRQYFKRWPFKY
ncbi:MAG: branched-chain amino acid ABC transporter permease [Deinococcota bacterium]|nr:branched-chain amino acid ABC transporter permease [Deinococcota bacterium]